MANVNDPLHAQVLRDAEHILKDGGCVVRESGFEHTFKDKFGALLQACDSVDAHVVRTRPDRMALLNERLLHYDAKTCSWTTGQDFSIEALPFLRACCEAKALGTQYLFCCQRHDGSSYGLFASEEAASLILRVSVPRWRRDGELDRWTNALQPMLDVLGCRARINYNDAKSGSGDVLVCLAVDTVSLPTWKDAIQQWIVEASMVPA